ncbi:unnamed protein product [Sphagnum jensenii]|uniref:MSP domain-containing protein n=1 Tax=Sphagnum jensenii TaxID=128206 RepID=A0ABP0X200_9BRYO
MPNELLSIQPGELKFPFELKKQISSSLRLINSSDSYVAFKVKTTSPKKYCVRPNNGIVLPQSSADVTVTMQAQREAPPDMQCKDKFLVQSVVAPVGSSPKDVSPELFSKESGKEVHEAKLRVLYVSPPQPPSPITESNEEGLSPKMEAAVDNGDHHFSPLDPAKGALAMLTEERNAAIQQNARLQQELVCSALQLKITLKANQKLQSGFSFFFVILVALLSMLVGYLLGG